MMRPLLFIITALSIIGLAYWAYNENYKTQEALKQVSELRQQIGDKREALRVLKSEWAYLNRPERLRELTDLNFNSLELMPLAPEQFGEVRLVAFPTLKIDDVNGPVDVSAEDSAEDSDAKPGGKP